MFGTTARATLIVSAKDEASDVMATLARNAKQAEGGIKGMGEAADGAANGGMGKLAQQMIGAAGITIGVAGFTAAAVSAGKQAWQLGMQAEQTAVAFRTLLGSTEAATAHLKDLRDFAAQTPFQFDDLTQSSKRLQALGFEAKAVVPMLRDIGDAVAAMGGNSQMIDRVVMALGQMQAKGKASGEELLQLTEAGIPALKYMAKEAGVSTAEMQKLVSKGLVPADQAIQAILAGMRQDFGGMMAEQAKTAAGQISNLEDAWKSLLTTMGSETTDATARASGALATFLNNYTKAVTIALDETGNMSGMRDNAKFLYAWSAIQQAMGDTKGATESAAEATRLLDIFTMGLKEKYTYVEREARRAAEAARWEGIAEHYQEIADSQEDVAEAYDATALSVKNLSSLMQGALGKELDSNADKTADLKQQQADLKTEIDKLTASHGKYWEHVEQGNTSTAESTLYTLQLADAQKRLAEETDPLKQAQLAVQIEGLQSKILDVDRVTSGYVDNSKKIGELTGEYDEVTAAIEAQEIEHTRATRMILFNIVQQQLANAGLLEEGGPVLLEMAKKWGLIDQATYDATQEILTGVNAAATTGDWQLLYNAADTARMKLEGIPTSIKTVHTIETHLVTINSSRTNDAGAGEAGIQNWSGGSGSPNSTVPQTSGWGGEDGDTTTPRAFGGPVRGGGRYLTGESVFTRPEVFVPGTSGAVLTRQQAEGMFGGAGEGGLELAATLRALPRILARELKVAVQVAKVR